MKNNLPNRKTERNVKCHKKKREFEVNLTKTDRMHSDLKTLCVEDV